MKRIRWRALAVEPNVRLAPHLPVSLFPLDKLTWFMKVPETEDNRVLLSLLQTSD